MLKNVTLCSALLVMACAASVSAHALADVARKVDVPAGDLTAALRTLAKQSGVEFVYSAERLKGVRTLGVRGEYTPEQAVSKLLESTELKLTVHPTGALLISDLAAGAPGSVLGSEPPAQSAGIGRESSSRFRLAQADAVSSDEESASTDGKNLEEVIVTAQKREERLQDVPVPMTVLGSEALVKSGQVRLRDYFSKVPGLSLSTDPQGEVQVTLRGIGTGSGNPSIGVTLDDMPLGATVYSLFSGAGAVMPEVDPSDLSRMEILRGPQGTLYGSSSIGGLFKFVTATPSTDKLSGRMEAGVNGVAHGDDLGWAVRGAVNVPISDNMAVRASAYGRRDPGYVDNVLTGDKDANSAEARGGRLSMLYQPTENVSLLLGALVQEYDRNSDSLVDPSLSDYQVLGVKGAGASTRRFSHYSARLNIDFGGMDLNSLTAYQVNDTHSTTDVSALGNIFAGPGGLEALYGPGASGMYFFGDGKLERFTQEIRLASRGDQSIEWLLGAFYSHEKAPGASGWRAVNPLTKAIAGRPYDSEASSVLSEIAGFANVDVHLSEKFDVQVGGRVGEYSLDVTDYSFAFPIAGVPVVMVPDQSTEETASTFLVTPRYKFSQNQMIYARVASGYRPGGVGGNGAPIFKSDTSINYELGLKGSYLHNMLTIDASIFRIDWKDIQIGAFVPGVTLGVTVTNAAEARSEGVELSAEVRPSTGLSIRGSFVYNDAKITQTLPPPVIVQGQVGDSLPSVSPYSGSLSIEQEFPVHLYRELTGFIGADAAFVDDRADNIRADATDVVRKLPSYTTVDLRAGLRSQTWALNAYVNNIGDKKGVIATGFPSIDSLQLVQPRNFGLVVSYEF